VSIIPCLSLNVHVIKCAVVGYCVAGSWCVMCRKTAVLIAKVQESAITWTNKRTLFSGMYIIIRIRDLSRRYQDELSDWN
jgi:hypothetical protein